MKSVSTLFITLTFTASSTFADQQIIDDLIVQQSLCVGQDCVNGENFGFDTIRLKENNLRIKFQDTSVSASFPTRDWQIKINDSENGGANYFAIENIDSATIPFKVADGAKNHALYVGANNRIGINTSAPAQHLHVVDGNSPTLRLEQDGTSGFTPQTWDVAGNETNFFIRDVSGGGQLPFRILAGAPASSIYIAQDGDVGFKTTSPDGIFDIAHPTDLNNHAVLLSSTGLFGINVDNGFIPRGLLDVQTTGGVSRFHVASDGKVGIGLHTAGTAAGLFDVQSAGSSLFTVATTGKVGVGTSSPDWNFHVKNTGTIISQAESTNGGAVQLRLKSSSTIRRIVAVDSADTVKSQLLLEDDTIRLAGQTDASNLYARFDATGLFVNGSISTPGGTLNVPDYVFESNYKLMPLDDLKLFLKQNKHLPEVPSANEVAKNGLNLTEMQLALLKKVEELTLYTLAQQEAIKSLQAEIKALSTDNDKGNF
jgi:hypothetical protein